MNTNTTQRGHTLEEARQLLGGISAPTLHKLINSGELVTFTIGRRRFVQSQAIFDYMERHRDLRK